MFTSSAYTVRHNRNIRKPQCSAACIVFTAQNWFPIHVSAERKICANTVSGRLNTPTAEHGNTEHLCCKLACVFWILWRNVPSLWVFFFFNLLTTEDYLQVILQSPPHQLSQRSLLQRDKYFLRCYFLPPRCLVARINQQFCLKCTSLSLRSSGLLSWLQPQHQNIANARLKTAAVMLQIREVCAYKESDE